VWVDSNTEPYSYTESITNAYTYTEPDSTGDESSGTYTNSNTYMPV
jgi:hypothetical protein